MVCINELFNGTVLPVTGESVLRQVIGTYAEKVNKRSKFIAYDSCCGSFDHYTEFCVFIEVYSVSAELLSDLCAYFFDLFHLRYTCYHREHDTKLAECGSPVKGTELCPEYLWTS